MKKNIKQAFAFQPQPTILFSQETSEIIHELKENSTWCHYDECRLQIIDLATDF